MSTDRELLELAAKAAGIEGFVGEDWSGVYFCTPAKPDVPRSEPAIYHWLDDDGDALRLGSTLGLFENSGYYIAHCERGDYAAMRRAIIMTAADRGRKMP